MWTECGRESMAALLHIFCNTLTLKVITIKMVVKDIKIGILAETLKRGFINAFIN